MMNKNICVYLLAAAMSAIPAASALAQAFPNLTGAVSTFTGGNAEHRALLADRDAGMSWDGHLSPAGTMLVSAACHPSYGTLPKVLPEGGALMDTWS